ncbi:hypothetical protein OG225_43180 (plasmid) [Nocardia sp. NBC_01377]|uniref:hypothetical protein n=1 Tax=Nocardia sp. NBC_01377 TaxID=2903595 RepID=UPI002F906EC7
MIPRDTLRTWLDTLPADTDIAVDEGGLTLIAVDSHGVPATAHLEVGGYDEPDHETSATSQPARGGVALDHPTGHDRPTPATAAQTAPALPQLREDQVTDTELHMFECRTTECDWHSPWFPRRDPTVPAYDNIHAEDTGHENFHLYSLSRAAARIWRSPRR